MSDNNAKKRYFAIKNSIEFKKQEELNSNYEDILKAYEKELDEAILKVVNKYKFSEILSKKMPNYHKITKSIIYKAESENEKKGRLYELKIKKYYEEQGYKVFPHGFINGKNDGGIDLVCYKENECVLIQCKNHKSQIGQDLLRKFLGDCAVFVNENEKMLKNKTIKKVFISSSEPRASAEYYLSLIHTQKKKTVPPS
ncbi:restriction endonuclease [Campylobacter sp. 2018MI01]|uniref:restriction endonuclease n=1 Tax=Campylobacter sp. 2018MI01 TaxID=2836735 RepID=UPI001BDA7ADF|nr:restriction endonuclease [Campylobacter sp. 2018MI01]MBT0879398.1 restriction endonuclease [Campylobacter sp. 2018MI01]